MSNLRPPRFETARRAELREELIARARAWLPDWRPREGVMDFGGALFDIAARLESEVAQRLDMVPEKARRDFLHWLGVRGRAARAGRIPAVFVLAAGSEPAFVPAAVQMQASPPQTGEGGSPEPVTFETEQPLMLAPGRLVSMVGADPARDSFFLQPSGFPAFERPAPAPSEWRVKADAPAGATQAQLEPELGLDLLPALVHERTGLQYRVTQAEGGLVTLEPPIGAKEPRGGEPDEAAGWNVRDSLIRPTAFDPFGTGQRNRQEHAVYIGSESVLNLPAAARITISGVADAAIEWSYWGKVGESSPTGWQPLRRKENVPGLTLEKAAGALEVKEIGGNGSRWLRGVVAPGRESSLPVSRITLTVNCGAADEEERKPKLTVEGIANTTPLVLDAPFYPLGREPRLFDAFYIGCEEAFSKKNAAVKIDLKALDGTASAMTAAQLGVGREIALFAVGDDGNLHRLRGTPGATLPERMTPVRPPFSESGVAAAPGAPVLLNAGQPPRLSVLPRAASNDTLVAVTAGSSVWLWSENAAPPQSRWYALGTVGEGALSPDEAPPAALALADGDNIRLVALRNKRLYELVLPPGWEKLPASKIQWKPVPPKPAGVSAIAPVYSAETPLGAAMLSDGWVGVVGSELKLHTGSSDGPRVLVEGVSDAVIPLVVRTDPKNLLVVAQPTDGGLAAWRVPDGEKAEPAASIDARVAGRSLDWAAAGTEGIAVVFADAAGTGATLSEWYPMAKDAGDRTAVYRSARIPELSGAPAIAFNRIFAPGPRAVVVAVEFNAADVVRSEIPAGKLASALVLEDPALPPAAGDFLEIKAGSAKAVITELEDAPKQEGNRYWVPIPGSEGAKKVKAEFYHRRHTDPFAGSIGDHTDEGETKIKADAKDGDVPNPIVVKGSTILVELKETGAVSLHEVTAVSPKRAVLTVKPEIDGDKNDELKYTAVQNVPSENVPLLHLQGGVLPADRIAAMRKGGGFFRGFEPSPNQVLFLAAEGGAEVAAVFQTAWSKTGKPANERFTVSTGGIFGKQELIANTAAANPALSWEYFDGESWWRIKNLRDGTANLSTSGTVEFCVPPELKPADVAGRSNHWIRARLVGGDYGQETVRIRSEQDPNDAKVTIQTVERSRTGVVPPLFGSLDIQYSVCCAARPDYVLTEDGGGMRDQTAANGIDDARVELFLPLGQMIRSAVSGAGAGSERDRAIYLGFDTPLSGGPIGVLFLVEEGRHDAAYPLRLDVLRESGFEPVVAEDGTRGLNESGVVAFTLSQPPPAVALFGPESRYWLRLRPNLRMPGEVEWRPRIRGAYLNATFARASETQGLERLGSSDGSPDQRVFLARPPVLEGTLELRVREPLGDEEVEALRDDDPETVLDTLPNGDRGPWVLWERVADADDGGPGERAYALNDETGEISFGNGLRGRIPPIGIDAIVAVRYQRGRGAAANRISAWSEVNLISPVQGVERVFVPDGAAGGSDPQTAEEVLRFAPANQFMRDRALTLSDYESLALQSSRDVAQARALPRPGGLHLIVAMRGRNPQPNEAQRREIRRYLLDRSSPALSAEGALTIAGPNLVEARVRLALTILSVADSGAVAREVRRRVSELLDAAAGGLDALGWPLGEAPTDTDVAAALDGVEKLEEIDSVAIDLAAERRPVAGLNSRDLVVLAPEGVHIEFSTVGEEASA